MNRLKLHASGVVLRSLFAAIMATSLIAMGGGGAAMAQQASDADRAACRSDAMKFCRAQIGKPKEVLECLAKVKGQLSRPCATVVTANGG